MKEKPLEWRLRKNLKNPKYPYKRYVLCPTCRKPLYGSASRGKSGKLFPVYHCDKRNGHPRFSVPVQTFDESIQNFTKDLRVTNEGVALLKQTILEEWKKRITTEQKDTQGLETKIQELENQKKMIVDKIAFLTTEEAIRMMEDKMKDLSLQVTKLKETKEEKHSEDFNMEIVMEVVGYFLEHLEFLLLGSPNPIRRAAYFGLVFQELPAYQEILSRTPKLAPYIELIHALQQDKSFYVPLEGFAPSTLSSEAKCSIC